MSNVAVQERAAEVHERRDAPDPSALLAGGEAAFLGEAAAAHLAISAEAMLPGRRVTRHGETIILAIRPSRWFIVASSLRFALGIGVILGGLLLTHTPFSHLRYCLDAGLFVLSCRMMWATLQWMGRFYVLTDQRILRFTGVLHHDMYACPLRKIAGTRVTRTLQERLLRLGGIEVQSMEDERPIPLWQMINSPDDVHAQIVNAIRKARQGECVE